MGPAGVEGEMMIFGLGGEDLEERNNNSNQPTAKDQRPETTTTTTTRNSKDKETRD